MPHSLILLFTLFTNSSSALHRDGQTDMRAQLGSVFCAYCLLKVQRKCTVHRVSKVYVPINLYFALCLHVKYETISIKFGRRVAK